MMTSLKAKTISGVQWQMIGTLAAKALSVATFAVLARMIDPKHFGLFALAFAAIDAFSIFKNFGVDSALIQRKENTEEAAHTVYFILQGTSLLMMAACYLTAPLFGAWFGNPEIVSIVRALGIVFLLTGFSKIPSTLLTKQMRFKTLTLINLTASVIHTICVIALAFAWRSVWSLVAAYLVKQVVTAILTRHYSGYRVKWQFNPKIAKELFHYGKYMMALSFLWYLGNNNNTLIIGKLLGMEMLGCFTLAFNLGNAINTHFTYLIESVMFPAYATIQNDKEEVKRVYFKITKYVSLISVPFAAVLMGFSRELVLFLYGPEWLSIAPLIRLYGVVQLFVPILACSGSVFLGCGKPKLNWKLEITTMVLGIPLLIVCVKIWGLIGAGIASIALMGFIAPLNISMVRGLIPFRMPEFLPQFAVSLACGAAMLGGSVLLKILVSAYFSPGHSSFGNAVLFACLSVFGILVYAGALYVLDRSAFQEIQKSIFKVRAKSS